MFRRLRMAALSLAILIGVFGVSMWILVKAPALNGVRAGLAASFLSDLTGRDLVVEGDVSITLGAPSQLIVEGVSEPGASGVQSPVGRVDLDFSLLALLKGRFELQRLELEGLRFVLGGASRDDPEPLGRQVASGLAAALRSPILKKLSLEDVHVARVGDPDGWDWRLIADSVVARGTPNGGFKITARASLNGQPLELDAVAPDLRAATVGDGPSNLDFTLSAAGLAARFVGRLYEDDETLELSGRLDFETASLGELQEAVGLARLVEGEAHGLLELEGAVETLTARSTSLAVSVANGSALTIQGPIGDLWRGEGLALGFTLSIAEPVDKASISIDPANRDGSAPLLGPSPQPSAEPPSGEVASISGRIEGGASGVALKNVVLTTAIADVRAPTIGPISIGAVRRTAEGRVQLADIHLLQGDPRRPVLDVSGDLDDAVELEGWDLDAAFRLPIATVIAGRAEAGDLGDLVGTATISDRAGRLEITSLDAASTPPDVIAFQVRRALNQNTARFDIDLEIPDVEALATRIGRQASAGYAVDFTGSVALAEEGLALKGDARIGATAASINLRAALEGDTPKIEGSLDSPDLHLASLSQGIEIATLFREAQQADAIEVRENLARRTTVAFQVSADRVTFRQGRGQEFDATVSFRGHRLNLDPIAMSYAGGSLRGAIEADTASVPLRLQIDASGRGVALQQTGVLSGDPPLVSGALDFDASLFGMGEAPVAFAASMDGSLSGDLRDGRLGSDLVDLAGEHVIPWLFTRSSDGSAPITCAVASFDFRQGNGTAQRFVLETEKVQVIGGGAIDLDAEVLDMHFDPRPKRRGIIDVIGPVSVTGSLERPKVTLARGDVAKKVVADTIGAPLELLGSILETVEGDLPGTHRPCEVGQ